jgi:hypothetical protein
MKQHAYLSLFCFQLALLPMVSCGGRAKQTKPSDQHNVLASSPIGFSAHHIGKPHDERFQLLRAGGSRSIFKKRNVRSSPQGKLTTNVFKVADNETLTAHASAWGLVSAGAEISAEKTYVTRRLALVEDVLELDESSKMFKPPKGAVYYPWRVYRGWSFEVVCSGSSSKMNSSFEAQLLVAEGGVTQFAKRAQVDCETIGHGIEIDGKQAVFADSLDEIEKRFRSGPAVPILVEWRLIPGRTGKSNKPPQLREGCAGTEGCKPCERWEFSHYSWQVPRTKPDSNDWDGDGSPPDVVVSIRLMDGTYMSSKETSTFSVDWSFDTPLAVNTNETVIVTAVDKDVLTDDPMPNFKANAPQFLENGIWKIGHGAELVGTCVGPK